MTSLPRVTNTGVGLPQAQASRLRGRPVVGGLRPLILLRNWCSGVDGSAVGEDGDCFVARNGRASRNDRSGGFFHSEWRRLERPSGWKIPARRHGVSRLCPLTGFTHCESRSIRMVAAPVTCCILRGMGRRGHLGPPSCQERNERGVRTSFERSVRGAPRGFLAVHGTSIQGMDDIRHGLLERPRSPASRFGYKVDRAGRFWSKDRAGGDQRGRSTIRGAMRPRERTT